LLAYENVDFAQILYLSKFYEAIEAIEGVAFVTITEYRRAGPAGPLEEKEGKLVMGDNEIPKIPDGPGEEAYAGGIQVTVTGGY
jgi:hypothetical protein